MEQIEDYKYLSQRMIEILDLSSSPIGIKLLKAGQKIPNEVKILEKHRYCQAIMEARKGEDLILNSEGLSCPAAAAFGFRPLPEALSLTRD